MSTQFLKVEKNFILKFVNLYFNPVEKIRTIKKLSAFVESIADFFSNLKGKTRDDAVKEYRKLLILEVVSKGYFNGLFPVVNTHLMNKWSISSLEYIKNRAWWERDKLGNMYVVGYASMSINPYKVVLSNIRKCTLVGFLTETDAYLFATALNIALDN